MKGYFFAVFLVLSTVVLSAEAILRVAIHNSSCNSASLFPSSSSRISILQQLTVPGFMEAALINDTNINASSLANFDVIYVGCGGKDLNLEALKGPAATAIANFVSVRGGGLVLSATSATAFPDAQEILREAIPFSSMDVAWGRSDSGNSIPVMNFNRTLNHYITVMNVTGDYVAPYSFPFYVQSATKAGWVSVAETDPYSTQCCKGMSECGEQYCTPYKSQGLLVKGVGNGRVSYINFAFCGYEMFGPHNLRSGIINQVFLNMFYWSSGLCKSINDCSGHGACIGQNTCSCLTGWNGTDCSQPICTIPCENNGNCTAPNECTCPPRFTGAQCQYCAYPYAGENCSYSRRIQNPSFEDTTNVAWNLQGDATIQGSKDGVSPHSGSKMLILTGSSTANASQTWYVVNNGTAAPYISFYYRSSSASSSSSVSIKLGSEVVWTNEENPTTWTRVVIDLANKSSAAGFSYDLVIEGNMSSGSFYFDLIEDNYPECDPECVYGVCTLLNSRPVCACDEHHSGTSCSDPLCGDGVIMIPETCDDGNANSGDGCSDSCQIEDGWTCLTPGQPCIDICGDGRTMNVSDETACDDGNLRSGDGCSTYCKVEVGFTCTRDEHSRSICTLLCGDGRVFGIEKCDDKNVSGGCLDCRRVDPNFDCSTDRDSDDNECVPRGHGNGYLNEGEECDNGSKDGLSGCSKDGKIVPGWTITSNDTTLSFRYPKTILTSECGDGIAAYGSESCDQSLYCDNATCKPLTGYNCTIEDGVSTCFPRCGDGLFVPGEECDDNNQTMCFNCTIVAGYHCEDENNCLHMVPNKCGDGKVHKGEECDFDPPVTGCENCKIVRGYACNSSGCYGVCGDKIVTPGEVCDCGTENDRSEYCTPNNGCSADCKSIDPDYTCSYYPVGGVNKSACRPLCGDGLVKGLEECDDGNIEDGDGCSHQCKIEAHWNCTTEVNASSVCVPICGDTYVVGNETCDEGEEDTEGCKGCQVVYGYKCDENGHNCNWAYNDGIISSHEVCDDSGKSCSSPGVDCGCVEGQIQPGWECYNDTGPESLCLKKGCGNGILNKGEKCDDGNTKSGDGCSSTCQLELEEFECEVPPDPHQPTVCHKRTCGNSHKTSDEECDDGNLRDGDGCSSKCKIEPHYSCKLYTSENGTIMSHCIPDVECGDGFRAPYSEEECDDGNKENGDGCSADCKVEVDFVCTEDATRKSVCNRTVCGDGRVEGREQCDDGNLVNDDGCDSTCHVEPGFRCYTSHKKSVCKSYCGDGLKSTKEECDDGNVVGGDGCSPTCQIEHGYTCFINYTDEACIGGNCTSLCYATCGDGIVAQEEECDDGNSYQGDGCYNCKLESEDWRCRGEPSECIRRECILPYPEIITTNITCPGSYTGVIDLLVDSDEEIITKIWNKNAAEPASYKAVSHYTNLGAGDYWVKISITGFEECFKETETTLYQPKSFSSLKGENGKQFWYPTYCDKSDGKISWKPSGGTPPYKFLFANRPVQADGTWEDVNIREYVLGKPSIIDANNCTAEMNVVGNWPNESSCPDDSVPYLMEGSIILGAAFVIVIIAAISYSCWSSKRTIPRGNKGRRHAY